MERNEVVHLIFPNFIESCSKCDVKHYQLLFQELFGLQNSLLLFNHENKKLCICLVTWTHIYIFILINVLIAFSLHILHKIFVIRLMQK